MHRFVQTHSSPLISRRPLLTAAWNPGGAEHKAALAVSGPCGLKGGSDRDEASLRNPRNYVN